MDYFKNSPEPTVKYSIVYDFYGGGCSQQRMMTKQKFNSIEDANEYRWAQLYCSPPSNLEFRIIFNRLSNGGWDEKRYVYRKENVIDMERLSCTQKDYSKETMEKVDTVLKKHDLWRTRKING